MCVGLWTEQKRGQQSQQESEQEQRRWREKGGKSRVRTISARAGYKAKVSNRQKHRKYMWDYDSLKQIIIFKIKIKTFIFDVEIGKHGP